MSNALCVLTYVYYASVTDTISMAINNGTFTFPSSKQGAARAPMWGCGINIIVFLIVELFFLSWTNIDWVMFYSGKMWGASFDLEPMKPVHVVFHLTVNFDLHLP